MRICLALLAIVMVANVAMAGAGTSSHHRSTYCTACPRDSHGRIKRSSSARRSFLKSKGLKTTPEGCQVDHVVPLAKGG
jgi:hypothetical protein